MNDEFNEAPALNAIVPLRERPRAFLAACLALTHALAWAPFLVLLIRVVPSYKKVFADFALKLTELTMFVVDLSDLVVSLGWIGMGTGEAVLVALDFLALWLLLRFHKVLAWLWFGLLVAGAILSSIGCWLLVHLPLVEVMDELAR